MVLKRVSVAVSENMEIAKGLLVSEEDVLKIFQGTSQSTWEDFRLYYYSEAWFSHDKWDFLNPLDPLHLQIQSSSRKINWKTHPLPERMLEELKRITWTRIVTRGSLPTTLHYARVALKFLSQLVSRHQSRGLVISSLSQLNPDDIETALGHTEQSRAALSHNLKSFLLFAAEANVGRHVGIEVKWNRADIEAIPWERYNKEEHTVGPKEPLSSELFIYRSNLNRALVRDFLEALGERPEDSDPNPIYEEKKSAGELLSQCCPDPVAFAVLMKAYADTRGLSTRKNGGNGEKAGGNKVKSAFKKLIKTLPDWAQKMDRNLFGEILMQARLAAMQSVGSYTGMRESELKGVRQPLDATGEERCVRCDNGMWFLYSTVAKNAADGAAAGTHRWVAPTVIRDAIHVLVLQQSINANPYLTSGIHTNSKQPRPYASPAVKIRDAAITPHFKGTKWEDEMADWTHHTDRHTLVKELDAAGVQLVHISRQLYHTHSMLIESESSVATEAYGGIGEAPRYTKRIQTNPDLTKDIDDYREKKKRERYHAVLGEDAVLAGPGGEPLKAKIDAKFQGLGFAGEDRKEYIDMLVDSGFPLPTSGFGVCGQEAFEMEDEPPCMGDYECDPSCKSCIVTPERTYQAVNEFHRAIRMQLNDEQKRNWKYWQQREKVFSDILTKLGKNPSDLKEKYLRVA